MKRRQAFQQAMKRHQGNCLAVASEINHAPVGPTSAQTIEDKIKEIEALGFHGLTLELLGEICRSVYEQMLKDGKAPNLARREIGHRIRGNLGANLFGSPGRRKVSNEINEVLSGVPRDRWVMSLNIGGRCTEQENAITFACDELQQLECALSMGVAEYKAYLNPDF